MNVEKKKRFVVAGACAQGMAVILVEAESIAEVRRAYRAAGYPVDEMLIFDASHKVAMPFDADENDLPNAFWYQPAHPENTHWVMNYSVAMGVEPKGDGQHRN